MNGKKLNNLGIFKEIFKCKYITSWKKKKLWLKSNEKQKHNVLWN